MDCADVRRRLLAERGAPGEEARQHLATCQECARYATRLAEVRGQLAARRLPVSPDPGFAGRVLQRLPAGRPADTFAWAALRLLPAALVLALGLAWAGWRALPAADDLALAGSDPALADLLSPEVLP